MKKDGYYSSGKFAEMAHVTKKTLRYYDEQNILKPSFVAENGTKFYTDNDFAKLQQILFLKYLSFPLADIKELTVRGSDRAFWLESLKMQTSLLEEHIEQMKLMSNALQDAQDAITKGETVNWSEMLRLANSNEMEQMLKKQYIDSSNISARINLHTEYSGADEDWFCWLFRMANIKSGESVLELGCGDGSFWMKNSDLIPANCKLLISDISSGIVRETEKKLYMAKKDCAEEDISAVEMKLEKSRGPLKISNIALYNGNIDFRVIDANNIPLAEQSMDVVVANHMLFYCEDLDTVLSEIKRVLKHGGRLVCSTYSSRHMSEVSRLVRQYDDRIVLSKDVLYEKFGKENGSEILSKYFSNVEWHQFEDSLCVSKPEPLISYILSCHGNQNRYIVDKYHDFYAFVKARTDKGFHITKDAGVFIAEY